MTLIQQLAVDAFENSIATAAQHLKERGQTGLILLPGVDELLKQVRRPAFCVGASAQPC